MQKRFLVLLTVTLTLGLLQPIATAAPKPGTACKKAGQTSTSAGIKYTCVKSGKKLVWNKGVAIKAAIKPELNPVLPVEARDLLVIDPRILSMPELTALDICKTVDKTPDYLRQGAMLHKNGFPRPTN